MKKTKIILIGAGSGIILIALFIILNILSKRVPLNPVGTVGNTPGNLANGGYFCQIDDVVYFANPYDNGSLYSMKPDETEIKKLVTGDISYINASKNYVYYYNAGQNSQGGLGSIVKNNGFFSLKRKKSQTPKYIEQTIGTTLSLIDNTLYYQIYDKKDHLSFIKMDIDGSNRFKLSDDPIAPTCAAQSAFYYTQYSPNMFLYCWDTTDDSRYPILEQDVFLPVIDGSDLYFIDIHNGYHVCRYSLIDQTITEIIPERVDFYNLTDDRIFYQTAGDEIAFKAATKDGEYSTVIADGAYCAINCTSQYVYFRSMQSEFPVYKVPVDGISVSTFDAARDAAVGNMKKK